MKSWKIPLFKMYSDDEDVKTVTAVLKRGMFWGLSSETLLLEKMISDKVGTKYAVAFNSGTSALHALLLAHGIKKPDEIIVPSFSFIATSNSVLFVGGKPIFADIEDETFGLDPFDVQFKLTTKTKAIIPVHYAGNVCKINELKQIASKSNLLVIEDAAEALGSKLGDKNAGSFGDSAILSFAWNKIITMGEGGAALTNSKKIFEKLLLLRSHGRIDTENYFLSSKSPQYVTLGYNWRISAMTAALGISQLKKLDKLIELRIKKAAYLSSRLSRISFIETPKYSKETTHTFMMYTIRIKNGKRVRDQLRNYLTSKGIQTKVNFEPIHLTKFYKEKFGHKKGMLPNTEKISNEVLTLPLFPHMEKLEMDYIIKCIREFYDILEK